MCCQVYCKRFLHNAESPQQGLSALCCRQKIQAIFNHAAAYRAHASALKKTINTVFWDENDEFYYDRNEKTGARIRVKSVAGFVPLWAGVASLKQAERLVKEHLLSPHEFWIKYPVASYARTEADYYQGSHNECNWRGAAWIPLNYMIFHGLIHYGYKDTARQLADKTFRMALDDNPVIREYYNGETGEGIGMNPFYGWSSLAYVMPLEEEQGYDPTDLGRSSVRPLLKEMGIPGVFHRMPGEPLAALPPLFPADPIVKNSQFQDPASFQDYSPGVPGWDVEGSSGIYSSDEASNPDSKPAADTNSGQHHTAYTGSKIHQVLPNITVTA